MHVYGKAIRLFLTTRNSSKKKEGNNGDYILELYVN